jgi:hypothetical protein
MNQQHNLDFSNHLSSKLNEIASIPDMDQKLMDGGKLNEYHYDDDESETSSFYSYHDDEQPCQIYMEENEMIEEDRMQATSVLPKEEQQNVKSRTINLTVTNPWGSYTLVNKGLKGPPKSFLEIQKEELEREKEIKQEQIKKDRTRQKLKNMYFKTVDGKKTTASRPTSLLLSKQAKPKSMILQQQQFHQGSNNFNRKKKKKE